MFDAKVLVQQMYNDSWTNGNFSIYATHGDYFVKCLKEKLPSKIHRFVTEQLNDQSNIVKFTPQFVSYYESFRAISPNTDFREYKQVYVFDRVKLVSMKEHMKGRSIAEALKILEALRFVLYDLSEQKLVYHDMCWANLQWNQTENRAYVVDIDSVVDARGSYDTLINAGDVGYHFSFMKFREKYQKTKYYMSDIRHLNLCIYHHMLVAFMLAIAQDDSKLLYLERGVDVKNVLRQYIMNGGDKVDVLKNATHIVSSVIEGTYAGNDPFETLYLIAEYVASNANVIPSDTIATAPKPQPVPEPVPPITATMASKYSAAARARSSAFNPSAASNRSQPYTRPVYTPPAPPISFTVDDDDDNPKSLGILRIISLYVAIAMVITIAIHAGILSAAAVNFLYASGIFVAVYVFYRLVNYVGQSP